jgi:hypothetical protein
MYIYVAEVVYMYPGSYRISFRNRSHFFSHKTIPYVIESFVGLEDF